jgi:RNA 2',3'-cyclic 3'-phosphodiesterase
MAKPALSSPRSGRIEGAAGRRLFFALWPDPALQAAMAATGERIARTRKIEGRIIPAERLHLTLLFLGEIPPDAEKRLIAAAGRIEARPFDLILDRAGCFFRSKVFWLGPQAVPRKLNELAEALHAAMAGVGLAPERKELVPHVTCRRDIRHVIKPVPVDPVIWQARSFALVESVAAQYHVVSHWPLQTASMPSVKTVNSPGGPE